MSLTVFLAFCILEIDFPIYALFQMVFAALFARQLFLLRWEPFRPNPLPSGSDSQPVLVTLVALSYLPALALGPVLERVLFDR